MPTHFITRKVHDIHLSRPQIQTDPLNRKLSSRSLIQRLLVVSQLGGDLAVAVILDNLGAVADKQLGVDKAVDIAPDGTEELGLLDALEKVVAAALLLDDIGSLVGEDTDLLVGLLSGNTVGGELHEDGLGGHEGELLVDAGADDAWVEDNAVGNIVQGKEDRVGKEELSKLAMVTKMHRTQNIPSRGYPCGGWRCHQEFSQTTEFQKWQ